MKNAMHVFLNQSLTIGGLQLPNRLIQGPLAGYSCAPFRRLYNQYHAPAYCVSEMISAHDVLHKHALNSRYIYRAPEEKIVCYQLSGRDPKIMAAAAHRLEVLGASLIDINCGCPKTKIRKKGTGSALLEEPQHLMHLVHSMRQAIKIPLTVKLRIQGDERDIELVQGLEQAGADAIIVHGRRWVDDYDVLCNYQHIGRIKQALKIPVIANGDIVDYNSLVHAITNTQCDAFMIARAGCGHPWIYQHLLTGSSQDIDYVERVSCFMTHLQGLAQLETDYQAVLQSKSLVRYYFKPFFSSEALQAFYALDKLLTIKAFLLRTPYNDC